MTVALHWWMVPLALVGVGLIALGKARDDCWGLVLFNLTLSLVSFVAALAFTVGHFV